MNAISTAVTQQQLIPARSLEGPRPSFNDKLLGIVASAADVGGGIAGLVSQLQRSELVTAAEWWTKTADDQWRRREVWDGRTRGERMAISIGAADRLVLFDVLGSEVRPAVTSLVPVLHHRWIGEQLARQVGQLARDLQALDDLGALIAHDVRSTLLHALEEDMPRETLTHGLALVDSILEAARAERGDAIRASDCIELAIADVGDVTAQVFSSVDGDLPVPAALRLVLRSVVGNSVAASSQHIDVISLARRDLRVFVVDDDGVGLDAPHLYATGSQVGLALCSRIVTRLGGTLTLKPRVIGGTRAMIVLRGVEG